MTHCSHIRRRVYSLLAFNLNHSWTVLCQKIASNIFLKADIARANHGCSGFKSFLSYSNKALILSLCMHNLKFLPEVTVINIDFTFSCFKRPWRYFIHAHIMTFEIDLRLTRLELLRFWISNHGARFFIAISYHFLNKLLETLLLTFFHSSLALLIFVFFHFISLFNVHTSLYQLMDTHCFYKFMIKSWNS